MSHGFKGCQEARLVAGRSRMEISVTITIADTTTRFTLASGPLVEVLLDRYEAFISDEEPLYRFQVTAMEAPDNEGRETTLGEQPRLTIEGDNLSMERSDFKSAFNISENRGTLDVHESVYSFDAFYRVFYTWLMLRRGGFMLHASSVVHKGKGYIFTGSSGSGKSTISGLSPENTLLSDELTAVLRKDGEYIVHGNPFWGDFQKGTAREQAPVAHLFFLRKARENRIDQIPMGEKLKKVLQNVLFFGHGIELTNQLLTVFTDFMTQIPSAELHFMPDESVWRCIDNAGQESDA
jgi:hypothetical protein